MARSKPPLLLWIATGSAVLSQFVAMPVPASAADIAFGEYLASECVTCHQASGKTNGIPAIVGWPQESFIAVLNSYKVKERDNVVMQTIAGRLKDDEVAALAAYFESLGSQPVAK